MKKQAYKLPESARQAIFAESDSGREKARIENSRTQFKQFNLDLDFFGKELAKKNQKAAKFNSLYIIEANQLK